jgi:O-antigen ligase
MPATVADLSAGESDVTSTLFGRRFRLLAPESLALFIIGMPIAWLTWRNAGVDPNDQALAFGWILGSTASLGVFAQGRYSVALPWSAVMISLIPALQLLPLHFAPSLRIETLQQQLLVAGIPVPGQVSIYPYATLQGSFLLAGCCALFSLARSLTSNSKRASIVIVGAILAVGLIQSVIGFQQHLAGQSLDNSGSQFARGSFVNRDHFAALMEGCFGLAVGVTLAVLSRRRRRRWLVGRESALTVGALLVGTACAAATIFSYSRMGILVLATMSSIALVLAFIRGRGGTVILALAGVAATFAVSIAGLRGLSTRFAELITQQGDPGRLAMWRDTLRIAPDFLWTGAGLGAFPFAFRRSEPYLALKSIDHAHSDYLEVLVELGLPGALLLFGSIGYIVIHTLWRLRTLQDPERRWTAVGCLLGAGGIFLHAVADFPLHIPAVAIVTAVLLGCARGLIVPPCRPSRIRQASGVLVIAGIAGVSVLFLQGHWSRLDAASLSRQAHAAAMRGLLDDADRAYTAALTANPFAAATWIARAELTETKGEPGRSLHMMRVAQTIEPFTLRTEWALANLLMRQGKQRQAARHFGALAQSVPQMRAAIVEAATAGGIDPLNIAADVIPADGEAAGEFLIHLVRAKAWPQLVPSYEALPAAAKRNIPAHLLRYIFDRTFAANETATYLQLWKQMGTGNVAEDTFSSTLLAPSTDEDSQGYGLRWVERPHEGVSIRFDVKGSESPFIELRFTKPQNLQYAHLSRDFAVRPGQRYTLLAEVRTEDLTSNEGVRLLVASPRGSLIESSPFRRTASWQQVRLPFRAGPDDRVLRLFVVRYPAAGFDKQISGSFYLRYVRVIVESYSTTEATTRFDTSRKSRPLSTL